MKKISLTILLIVFTLVSSIMTASSYGKNYWDWGTSESAIAFVNSMTNRDNGVLMENFPLKSWTIKVEDKEKFNSLISNKFYLRNFVAKRVWNICKDSQSDVAKCDSARRFLKKSWIVEDESGHLASYELALVFYKVDYDNWFSFERVRKKIEKYLDVNYGTRLLRLYKGFKHDGVLVKGGITIVDLPVVINTDEQTITIYSATLYD